MSGQGWTELVTWGSERKCDGMRTLCLLPSRELHQRPLCRLKLGRKRGGCIQHSPESQTGILRSLPRGGFAACGSQAGRNASEGA